ncbi:MAG: DEAD/DEAH box helicase, partial [Patescibacteria group bacterium]|nr:DEAD/DEAH box helicase [Patescibacteria group bacterium]
MRENLPLSTPLTIGVLGTNRTRIQKLAMMGISTIGDLLEYYPRAHEDTTEITPIFQLRASNDIQTARGRIVFIKRERSPKRAMQLVRAVIADASGQVECVWFQQGHLPDLFRTGDDVLISGKLKENYGGVLFSSPKIEKIGTQKHIGRVAAVYPESEIITSQWLREKISLLLGSAAFFEEFLPEEVLLENDLISRSEAIRQIHQPESNEALLAAKKRLAFEELFLIQLIGLKRKLIYQRDGSNKKTAVKMDAELVKKFLSSFKFQATSAQKIAIFEILKDLEKPFPMNRLLQGDVGSGKTLVAITVILQVIKSGFQAIILAPTEVLARQHFALIKKELPNNKVVQQILGRSISAELLIGSTSQKDKIRIKSLLEKGELDFVVGTHALLTDDFSVARLGLVVIDEQHRFGVEQREELKKHNYPHILTMTATPIPRTLALTIFGDQDFSVLDEMPVGRKAVITRIVPEAKRDQAYEFCRSEIAKGNKIFVIAPLVEESEKLDVASATEEYDKW